MLDLRIVKSLELALIATAGLLAGAEPAYAPQGATGWDDDYRTISLALPAGAPHGTVELVSFGVVELAPEDMPPMPALHVRLTIHDSADEVWSVDLAAVTLELGDLRLRPALVNSDLGTLPLALVGRTDTAVADLYFALPGDAPAAFVISWKLATPAGVLAERTRFAVDTMPPPAPGVDRRTGWGKRWWFDPSYAWPAYAHRPGVIVSRPPTRVFISRPPARHEPSRLYR